MRGERMSRIRNILFAVLCGVVLAALPLAAQDAPAPDTTAPVVEDEGFDIEENLQCWGPDR